MTDAARPEYAAAAAWSAEVHGSLRAARRTAWIVAAGAVASAAFLGVALAGIGPITDAAPFAVTVETQAGYAQAVRRLTPGALVEEPAVIDAYLAQYVVAREAFDAGDLRDNYDRVVLWSDNGAGAAYRQALVRTNPASPLAVYAASTTLTPIVKSVSRLSPTQALVRFDVVRRDAGLATGEQRGWQATVTYRFAEAPMRNADRFGNPLGFQVVGYQSSPDGTLPVQVSPASR